MARIYRVEDYSKYDLDNIVFVVNEFHDMLGALCDANIMLSELLSSIPYRRLLNILFF